MRFASFEHPRACDLLIALKHGGIESLFDAGAAREGNPHAAFMQYAPSALVGGARPRSDLDFDVASPYGAYNWELLFHAPLLIATRLAKEGRHDEAQRWFHFIFDPTVDDTDPSPKRFWRFEPLRTTPHQSAKQLLAALSASRDSGSQLSAALPQLQAWQRKPFNPHAIARLRTSAYQKTVLMKYIDNLLEWGDRLFRQDTMETIQEATQLYILASNILGPRQERVRPAATPTSTTFGAIQSQVDYFANWPVQFESAQLRRPFQILARPDHNAITQVVRMQSKYFCVPHNPQLEKYWDTVADRLFKIRNCMNIQGVVRQLALFDPPLDPGMLVRALGSGADLSSVLSNLNSPPPSLRFTPLLRRAIRLAEELRSFSAQALRALERRDAEGLATLRATNELGLHRALRDVRKLGVKQVEEELAEVNLRRDEVDLKMQHLNAQVQQLMNPQENASQAAMIAAKAYTVITEGIELASKIAYAIPEFQSGGAGMSSPFVTLQLGGQMFGSIISAVSSSVQKITDRSEVEAELAQAQAEYQRRRTEWQQELEVLSKEKAQLDKQIASINLKLEIATKELRRAEIEIDNADKVQEHLRSKFTNEQLYIWMLGQLATAHFQAYKFAFDAAQQAQRALQFELGDAKASYIEFSYWDSLRKGLFSGERLLIDLRRLETAYLDGAQRALEVTRHLSLRQDLPLAFDELLITGRAEFEVSESLLDGDFPGQYFRRLKNVSVSIPGPKRPWVNVNCSLTLLNNRLRADATASGNYAAAEDGEDPRFLANLVPIRAIATSQTSHDAGVFKLRFDDDRLLPFEGAGAISNWRLTLHQGENALNVSALDDVVVSLSYTARNAGAPLEAAARAHRERGLTQGTPAQYQRISLKREAANLFTSQSNPKPEDVEARIVLNHDKLPGRLLPFDVRVERVIALIVPNPRSKLRSDALRLRVEPPKGQMTPIQGFTPAWPGARASRASAEASGPLGEWKIALGASNSDAVAELDDIVLYFELRTRRP